MNIDYHSTCELGQACYNTDSNVSHQTPVKNYPLKAEYDSIQEPEVTMYHGTFSDHLDSILSDGFKPEMCRDPSFGVGLYLTPCVRMAKSCAGPTGAVLVCKVKLGKVRFYDSYDPNAVRSGQDTNQLKGGYEYVAYDARRVLPVTVLYRTQ